MVLTHGGRDEMDNISQTTFSDVFSSMKILLMFDPNGPINNIRSGAKPLSEPMAPTIIWTNGGWFSFACMRHSASID